MNIYDCFLYNGESKMLNFRLHELDEYVDKFIVVESIYTFKGDKKSQKFNIEDYKKFKDKIIYKLCDIRPLSNAWSNETNQRNFLKEGFRGLKLMSDDIVMLSDVDEIPDLTFLKNIKLTGFKGVKTSLHNFYYYNIRSRKEDKWCGTVIISADIFKSQLSFDFDRLRNMRWGFAKIGESGNYTSGGWHFSYFGDIDYIIDKIESFSHQEYNSAKYKDKNTIKKLIEEGKDLFFRDGEDLNNVVETYLPKYIHLLDS